MQALPYSKVQLQATVDGLKILATVPPERDAFVASCARLGWPLSFDAGPTIEFGTPCTSPLFVTLHEDNSIAGGYIPLCLLGWDEYEARSDEAQQSQASFDAKYIETVSVVGQALGEPDLTITEAEPCRRCSLWRRQNAFILVMQGAEDIEGIDIRLWLEYFDGNDIVPDSGVYDWLSQRHLSKLESAD